MPETDPIEFTDREKFLLSYYRDPQLSGTRRNLGYNIMFAIAAIACAAIALAREEPAFWFVGYALLLGRIFYYSSEGRRWTKVFQTIFAKYDAKVKALTATQKEAKGPQESG